MNGEILTVSTTIADELKSRADYLSTAPPGPAESEQLCQHLYGLHQTAQTMVNNQQILQKMLLAPSAPIVHRCKQAQGTSYRQVFGR